MDIPGLDIFAGMGCCIMLPCLETLHNISKDRELTQIFPKRENNIEMLPNVSGEKTNDRITACYFQREKTCNKDLQMDSSALQAWLHTGCQLYVLHGPPCLWTFSMKLQQLAVSGLDWCWYSSMKGLTKALLC